MNEDKQRKTISKLNIMLSAILIAVCAFGIPSVYALFTAETNSAENKFTGGIVNVAVVEKGKEHEDYVSRDEVYNQLKEANDSADKVVSVLNKGNSAYVRVTLEANLVSDTDENTVLLDAVKVEYTLKKNTDWKVDANGVYYFTKPLAQDESTANLLEKVTIKQDVPEGYHLEVKVLTDAISAKSTANLLSAWGIKDFSEFKAIN